MWKTHRYIKTFLRRVDIIRFNAAARLPEPQNPYSHEVCICGAQGCQKISRDSTRVTSNDDSKWRSAASGHKGRNQYAKRAVSDSRCESRAAKALFCCRKVGRRRYGPPKPRARSFARSRRQKSKQSLGWDRRPQPRARGLHRKKRHEWKQALRNAFSHSVGLAVQQQKQTYKTKYQGQSVGPTRSKYEQSIRNTNYKNQERLTRRTKKVRVQKLVLPRKTCRSRVSVHAATCSRPDVGVYCGGGVAPRSKDLVKAICLSLLDDASKLEALFAQSWVATWKGWNELEGEDADVDAIAMDLAQRLLRIAGANVPTYTKSNARRLKELAAQGLALHVASPHGANNCLIDALLLGMLHAGLTPGSLSVENRRTLCEDCRTHLFREYGVPRGVYLDGHRDAPRILQYFLQWRWQQDVSVRVHFYDALDHSELGAAAAEVAYVDFTWGNRVLYERVMLHVYNQTVPSGQGYHFDALYVPATDSVRSKAETGAQHCAEETGPGNQTRTKRARSPGPSNTTKGASETKAHGSDDSLRCVLQNFYTTRGCEITIGATDVDDVRKHWGDRDALSIKLHTLLQAGLVYADSGAHASRRLVDQWFAYHAACTQGLGQALGGNVRDVAASPATREKTPVDASAPAMRSPRSVRPSADRGRAGAAGPCSRKRQAQGNGSEETARCVTSPRTTAFAPTLTGMPRTANVPPRKRLRTKTTVTEKDYTLDATKGSEETRLESDDYLLRAWSCRHGNPDPRAKQDFALSAAAQHIRSRPCLPQWMDASATTTAFDIPNFFCCLAGCAFEADTAQELTEHICAQHASLFIPLASAIYGARVFPAMCFQAYRALLTHACQQRAPSAHPSIDRACIRRFREAQLGDNIGAAICFLCARRFPYTNNMSPGDRIEWRQIIADDEAMILSLPLEEVNRTLSYKAYETTYLQQHSARVQLELRKQLRHWSSTLQLASGNLPIICCPEDKICRQKCPPELMCKQCQAPVCVHCQQQITRQKTTSALTLSNDMLVFYPPRDIYAEEITFMELVCASPCFTAMACFSLEKKLLGDRAMDQDAFMPRQRLVARGNATTFPLAWDTLLQSMREATLNAASGQLQLPKVGRELAEVVNVIIKAGQPTTGPTEVAKLIHQARVRRAVVIRLIEDAKDREHPAYANLSMDKVVERAAELPEDGVPPDLIALLPHDDHLDNVQCQKAATPTRCMLSLDQAAVEFAYMCKPNAVVNERTTNGCGDVNAQQVAMLRGVANESASRTEAEQNISIYTGNRLLDQFEPWYFAFAFAFLFPYATGMPDPPAWSVKSRYRRPQDAPRVELEPWMRCMARRCEAQLNRDWTFGFAAWNLFFRSAINLASKFSNFETPIYDERERKFRMLTPPDIEAGALELVKALGSTYTDVRGNARAVQGDVTKLPYVRHLRPAARKLLQHMRHTAQSLPGTQEARRQMRFEIGAMRVRYGVPLFITVSPDESHQWLFVRMARTRAADPVRTAAPDQEWICGDRTFPPLGDDVAFPVCIERLQRCLPGWQQRRRLLARDPLASVDGFHVLMQLLLKHLFGVNICAECPTCDATTNPCMDPDGCNSTVLGGVFGRVDAVYITIEAQKSTGSLHAHMQCFLQCLHQHTPLTEIFALDEKKLAELRRDYCAYHAHVAHSTYSGQSPEAVAQGIAAAEAEWPEYANDSCMTQVPRYQLQRAHAQRQSEEGIAWRRKYMEEDVVRLQYLKQHHYHPISPQTGERVPLRGCQKQDRVGVCKSDFPRDAWLCAEGKILCPCELRAHGLADKGRKNRLGALHGPYGHAYLNPCHPAILASMRGGNNDVQIPYRLPFSCDVCGAAPSQRQMQQIALAAQRAQDAQAGYCSDYCAKNQPMGFHEIKEFQKGHVALNASLKQENLTTIGKRHANRFLSDAYCKGVVRGQVECCNLRANHKEGQIVAAERISTAGFVQFPGHAYLQVLEHIMEELPPATTQKAFYVRTPPAPGTRARHLREAVTAQAYGHRPADSESWWLSPYEFLMYWDLVPTKVPHTKSEWEATKPRAWDVCLTPAGERKLQAASDTEPVRLIARVDYRIQLEASADRILYPSSSATSVLRHNWYLQRRRRPRCPHFARCPVPTGFAENAERNARLTSVYFRAWTLDLHHATTQVPYIGHLLGEAGSWENSLRRWLLRLPCAETKRYVGNFLSVYRVRPAADNAANSDDDGVDEPLDLQPEQVVDALRTMGPASTKSASKACNDDRASRVTAAMKQADALWNATVPSTVPLDAGTGYESLDPVAVQQAAKKPPPERPLPTSTPVPAATVAGRESPSVDKVRAWTQELRTHPQCNAEQRAFCNKVSARVVEEIQEQANPDAMATSSTPLRWVLHGGPGTGKSHVIKLLRDELFEKTLGWEHGVHFQIVSFQAVMAKLLEGETIHHAFGLDWNGKKDRSTQRRWELLRQTLQWRWLIVDEFSMVSAELLAELEFACRELMRDLGFAKYSSQGKDIRPFGGLNVILVGDVYQLPPPKGTFLGDIPWDLLAGRRVPKNATAHHGQTLLWGEAAAGMQGITELQRCERTHDAWLTELQDQLRFGALSNDNHAFLHGQPTTVPGSWTNGRVACNNASCAALVQDKVTPDEIRRQECAACKEDRASRKLVAQDAADPRFSHAFRDATAIFSTNDLKYHVNKRRAMDWAHAHGQQVHIAVAQDTASANVLQEKPDLAAEKVQWLQRHDKECGELYGMLPVCIGMPVRATDHLDRKRGILKGCKGTVVGWSTCNTTSQADGAVLWKDLPQIVYVQFETGTTWQIDGIPTVNVYPVTVQRRAWFLDRQRQRPQLRIWRKQFPLAPGFAITAHVAQGQTIPEGVIADLCLGCAANPFTAFVAVTRVKGRGYLLIYRPFAAAPFQKGVGLGRELLIRHLRREEPINWKALLAKYCEERPCANCTERKPSHAYTIGQWKRDDANRVCRECCQRHAKQGCPFQCHICKGWKPETGFPAKHRQRQCSFFRVCLTCEVTKPCHRCGKRQPEANFGTAAWKARNADRRVCKQCVAKLRGHWQCATCMQQLPVRNFTAWQAQRQSAQDGHQQCNQCMALAFACRYAHSANVRLERTRQRWREARCARALAKVRAEIALRVATHQARSDPVQHEQLEPTAEVNQMTAKPRPGEANEAAAPKRVKRSCGKAYEYVCPTCAGKVTSNVRTGKINHRTVCGQQFSVKDGVVQEKAYEYVCPACGGKVTSDVWTGEINHRTVCGKQFSVKDGVVQEKAYEYVCPACGGKVASNVRTGKINHRTVCGKQFSVKDGVIVQKTRGKNHKRKQKK
eukprot:Skav228932  [mRNA]  locus=scaffold2181:248822:258688:+ [translate_table: standard]